jgi:hypothetical protein
MTEARRRGGEGRRKVGGKVGTSKPPAQTAPPWVALASVADVRAGYGWTVAAVIEKTIGAKDANAIGVLLAGAWRAMVTPDEIAAARAEIVETRESWDRAVGVLAEAVSGLAPDARAAVLAAAQKAIGELPPRT